MSETPNEVVPDAVTKVARNLTEIEALQASLEDQAIRKANDRLMPGGLATVALASAANLEAWQHQIDTAERLWWEDDEAVDRPNLDHIEDEDPDWEPPLQTLLFWSEQWRREHGAEYGQRPTVASEANFIRYLLPWAWDNEVHWDDFAEDVRVARRRLESVLYAGDRPDRSRVVCPDCAPTDDDNDADADEGEDDDPPRLVKVYGPVRTVAYRCRVCDHVGVVSPDATHCPNPWCWSTVPPEPVKVSHTWEDRWKCPRCKRKFDEEDAREAHAKQLRSRGAERFVSLPDAVGTIRAQGRSERTIRKWLAPTMEYVEDRCTICGAAQEPQEHAACPEETDDDGECGGMLEPVWSGDREAVVEGWCEVATRRTWVWWPAIWHLHLNTATRKRVSA